MTEVFRSSDSSKVGHLQSLLEAAGIRTYYRNEYVSATTVAIPKVAPALCILEEADVERGVGLIRDFLADDGEVTAEERSCPQCGEPSPATFAACWNCGAVIGE